MSTFTCIGAEAAGARGQQSLSFLHLTESLLLAGTGMWGLLVNSLRWMGRVVSIHRRALPHARVAYSGHLALRVLLMLCYLVLMMLSLILVLRLL